jgi:hypothetical protein
MIVTTFVQPLHREVEKDGHKVQLIAPPPIVLMENGPMVKVRIGKPPIPGENTSTLRPSVEIFGLLDTGAFSSVITPEIANQLNLIQTGWQPISSVHSEEDRPVFFAALWFPWGSAFQTKIVSCNLGGGLQCLIGRDIMMNWSITYNGKEGFYTICE